MTVSRQNRVYIRDYCSFKKEDSDRCLVRFTSSFAFMEGKNWKDINYSKRFAETDYEETRKVQSANNKKLGVFARWFDVNTTDKSLKIRRLSTKNVKVTQILKIIIYRFHLLLWKTINLRFRKMIIRI